MLQALYDDAASQRLRQILRPRCQDVLCILYFQEEVVFHARFARRSCLPCSVLLVVWPLSVKLCSTSLSLSVPLCDSLRSAPSLTH